MITHIGGIALKAMNAPASLSHQVNFDYAKHDKPLGKPSQQRLGGQLDTWQLQFSLHYQFCQPQQSFEQLKKLVADGQPVPLVFENLGYQGNVTVNDLQINYKHSAINGQPLVIEGSLTLTEYVGAVSKPQPRPAVRKADKQTPIQATASNHGQTLINTSNPANQQMQAIANEYKAQLAKGTKKSSLINLALSLITRR